MNSAEDILPREDVAIAARGCEENVRQVVRYPPVLLFGHVWVIATGPSLDMEKWNALTTREEGACEDRVSVPYDD